MDPLFQRSGRAIRTGLGTRFLRSVPRETTAVGSSVVPRRSSVRRVLGPTSARRGGRWAGVLDGRLIHGGSRPVRPPSRPTGLRHEGTARPDTPSSAKQPGRRRPPGRTPSGIRATSAQRRTAAHPEPPGPAGSPGLLPFPAAPPLWPPRPDGPLRPAPGSAARARRSGSGRSGRSVLGARSLGAPRSVLGRSGEHSRRPLRSCEGSIAASDTHPAPVRVVWRRCCRAVIGRGDGDILGNARPQTDHFGPGSPTPAAPG